jgi:hypothetical protein
MVQGRQSFCFSLEAHHAFGILRERSRQHLDGYVAIQFGVARPIHLAHPARANRGDNFVGSEARAGGQGHEPGF